MRHRRNPPLWWLEGDGSDEDVLFGGGWEPPDELSDDELGNIFGDIVKGVGKVITAPVDLVASVLPKPLKKPFQAVSQFASPTHMLGQAMQGKGPITGQLVGSAAGRVSTRGRSRSPIRRATTGTSAAFRKLASGGMAGGDTKLMETMVKMLGAKDLMKISAATRPKLAAKSTSPTDKLSGQELLVQMVASAVAKKMAPDLNSINAKLRLAEDQRTATSEHLNINNTAAFRRKVLQDLMRISTCLPANNPTRARIRKIGLMSGLL